MGQRDHSNDRKMAKSRQLIIQEKKRHTRKHTTGSTRKKRVILLSKARGGKVHDKKQLDEEEWIENIPDEVAIEGDLGFQGLPNEFLNVHLPHKTHIPLVMEGGKQLGNRGRKQIVALAGKRKEI